MSVVDVKVLDGRDFLDVLGFGTTPTPEDLYIDVHEGEDVVGAVRMIVQGDPELCALWAAIEAGPSAR